MNRHPLAQVRAVDELIDDIGLAVFVTEFEDLDDVGVGESGGRPGFVEELFGFDGRNLVAVGDLEGHDTFEFAIACSPYRAEATCSHFFQEIEAAEASRFRAGFGNEAEVLSAHRADEVAEGRIGAGFNRAGAMGAADAN